MPAVPAARLAPAPFLRDAATAAMWVVVIVPPAFGFWLVAGDLAGVPEAQRETLILASLLGLGLATLTQVVSGYRMPVFEGPASTYFAAVAVVSVGGAAGRPEAVTGGLIAAGIFVFVLGAAGVDRALRRIFTPPVVTAFLLIVTFAVVPATVERAIGQSASHPWGVWEAWVSAAVVVAVGAGGQAIAAIRSYSLLLALLAGTACYAALVGLPHPAAGGGWGTPDLFPWGAPVFSGAIVAPFLIAGALASFNTVASINVMAETTGDETPEGAERRGLVVHGGAQGVAACFGNVLGNVPRLESSSLVRMLGNPRPRALGIAAAAVIVLAFAGPAVQLLARLPIPVSAALVAVVLGMMVQQSLRGAARFDARKRWLVVLPAVAPTFVWLAVSDRLSETAQLLANPMLIGVVLAVALDRAVRAPAAPRHAKA
jgi:xanthine/uracil permease